MKKLTTKIALKKLQALIKTKLNNNESLIDELFKMRKEGK